MAMKDATVRVVLAVTAVTLLPLAAAAQSDVPEGFKSLFNGKDLTGWAGREEFWSVEDGAITGQTTKDKPTRGNTFLIWQDGKPEDFELRIKWKILAHNSGVQYRSRDLGNFVVGGYQADIDFANNYTGILYDEKGRLGIAAGRGTKVTVQPDGKKVVTGQTAGAQEIKAAIKQGEWNEYVIIARGSQMIQKINGVTTIELTDEREKLRSLSGVLALQLHAGPPMKVQFKDIYLKDLKAAAPDAKPQEPAPAGAKKKIVLIAGPDSHAFDAHAHSAGCKLLAKCLNESGLGVEATVVTNGWPADEKVLDGAAAVVVYADGGGGHPFVKHLDKLGALLDKGVGLACLHYAVEVPKGDPGDKFLDWIGGYFETDWSVNPHWKAEFKDVPKHPITGGVKPFALQDEWYYHMRFRPKMEGVTPLLSALPPADTLKRKDGPHSNNPHVRAAVLERKEPQHLAWASVRKLTGGAEQRGFGTTAGHFHWNWAQDDLRRLVLNAIVWVAHVDVPAAGAASKTPTVDDLLANLTAKPPQGFDKQAKQKELDALNPKP